MLAIIGGTGLASQDTFTVTNKSNVLTSFGEPSSALLHGELGLRNQKVPIIFLSRHGFKHNIPPHKVNYRANIQALKDAGVSSIIAVNAVGGISEKMSPGKIVLPNQIIDYSYARDHTFFADKLEQVTHIDFSQPYTQTLIDRIAQAADLIDLSIIKHATYGCTQGPRLETSAEIQRLAKDGCDIVGMTAMPEAALARELAIDYASISFVANWGAGISQTEISMQEIEQEISSGMGKIKALLTQAVALI